VEYIVAMDGDDHDAVAATEGMPRIVGAPGKGMVTAVRNWNSAAVESSGDLLFVIADDLFPPPNWDDVLLKIVAGIDPRQDAVAVKVTDSSHPLDTRLRHPVISRAFYARFGLFSPSYRGVYCDDDITTRAFWRAMILDGRLLVLDHRHPTLGGGIPRSASQHDVNRSEEYEFGRAVYERDWSRRHRDAERLLVRPDRTASVRRLRRRARWSRARSTARYHLRCLRRAARPRSRLRRPVKRR